MKNKIILFLGYLLALIGTFLIFYYEDIGIIKTTGLGILILGGGIVGEYKNN